MSLGKAVPSIAALALGLCAAPAAAQLRPSAPDDIAAAVGDCWQAVNATKVDEPALKARGWAAGTFRSPTGAPVPGGMTVYGKRGSNVILMLATSVDPRGCLVMSRVKTLDDITTTAQAVLQHLKALDPKVEGKRPSASEVAYFSLPKAAVLRPTGSREKPSTTIQVSYTGPEKK